MFPGTGFECALVSVAGATIPEGYQRGFQSHRAPRTHFFQHQFICWSSFIRGDGGGVYFRLSIIWFSANYESLSKLFYYVWSIKENIIIITKNREIWWDENSKQCQWKIAWFRAQSADSLRQWLSVRAGVAMLGGLLAVTMTAMTAERCWYVMERSPSGIRGGMLRIVPNVKGLILYLLWLSNATRYEGLLPMDPACFVHKHSSCKILNSTELSKD